MHRAWRQAGGRAAELEGTAADADETELRVMARWRVDISGKELQQLGTVDAPNAWEALAKAVDLFDIRPALRSKTVVTRLEEPNPVLSPLGCGAFSLWAIAGWSRLSVGNATTMMSARISLALMLSIAFYAEAVAAEPSYFACSGAITTAPECGTVGVLARNRPRPESGDH
jgi:hypothetical protein